MAKQITRNHCLFFLCLSLPVFLFIRTQLSSTAVHMDEYDYLFVGKTLLRGGHWPTHSYIFGWDLSWLLLAWGDSIFGGVHGARLVASSIGVMSIVGMYTFVLTLWRNHVTALLAAILLGFEGAHLYTSTLATYDIISFTAFACALPCVLLVCQPSTKKLFWTVLSCAALSLAVLSKYTAIIYLPLIAVLVFWYSPRYALIGLLLIATILTTYIAINLDQLTVLYEVQIQGTHSSNATLSDIINRTGRQLWVILFFAGFSLIYALSTRHVATNKILILIAFSLPMFFYHLASQNVISLQKHLVYSSLFLIPVVSWWLHEIYIHYTNTKLQFTVVLTSIALFGFVNIDKLRTMQSSYPDVSGINSIASNINTSDNVLSEDPYLFRYLLIDVLAQENISETSWLDNNRDGKFERRDVRQAIWDRKFDYVFLNDQQHQEFNVVLRKMLALRNYELVFENQYRLETMSGTSRYGVTSMYRNTDASKETFTSTNHAIQSQM